MVSISCFAWIVTGRAFDSNWWKFRKEVRFPNYSLISYRWRSTVITIIIIIIIIIIIYLFIYLFILGKKVYLQ